MCPQRAQLGGHPRGASCELFRGEASRDPESCGERGAELIVAYPTQPKAWKRLGDAYARVWFTPRLQALFRRFLWWRRFGG